MKSIKSSSRIGITVHYVFLVVLSLFFIFPFFVMLSRSLMDWEDFLYPVKLFPTKLYFGAYLRAFDIRLLQYFTNSFIVIITNIIFVPLSAALVAYPFAKMNFPGRNFFFSMILATIMLPTVVVQIPQYVIYYNIGWIDTLFPLIVPSALGGGAMNIFLIRQFMKSLPNDISNAAKIDGANNLLICLQIIFPLCKPIILYVMINTFFAVWNDFTGPLLFLTSDKSFTLAIGIYHRFTGNEFALDYAMQMATGVIMLIPCAILFLLFQKQLIEGVTFTGIKG